MAQSMAPRPLWMAALRCFAVFSRFGARLRRVAVRRCGHDPRLLPMAMNLDDSSWTVEVAQLPIVEGSAPAAGIGRWHSGVDGMLTLSWALPLAGGILLLLVGNADGRRNALVRWLALAFSLAAFGVTLALWIGFDSSSAEFQFVERAAWIPAFGIDYYLGIDGISLLLVVLTGFLTPIALLSSWESIEKKVKEFSIFILALEAAMIGVFVSLDLFLFYVFWDAMLIPMYFLIGIWGYDQRIYAAIKFMLYTMAGSVLMLVAILGLAYLHSEATGSYTFRSAQALHAGHRAGDAALVLPGVRRRVCDQGAAVPVPHLAARCARAGAHGWLDHSGRRAAEDGHLRTGALRVPALPAGRAEFAPWIALLAVIGIVYGALVAMVQPDMKKLVAYSSVSHLGFVVLGICAMNVQGVQGAVYQMLAHGISTGGLFLLVGMLSDRRHTRLITEFGGLKNVMPRLTAAFLIITLASIGMPALNGFIGEFLTMLGRVSVGSALRGGGRARGDSVGGLHAVDVPARLPWQRDER